MKKNHYLILALIFGAIILLSGASPGFNPLLVTKSNSWIRDSVTVFDFVPLGTTLIQNPDRSLHLPSDKKCWYSNNYCLFGMGTTEDKEHEIIFHNGFTQGGGSIRISIDGSNWLNLGQTATLYYDVSGKKFGTGFPTVYMTDSNEQQYTYLAYDQNTRTWYYKLNITIGYLDCIAKAHSIPFWMGKASGPYVVHGLSLTREDLDVWGGYVDMCDSVFTSNFGGDRTYYGVMAMDREYHRSLSDDGGASDKLSFSCMSLHIPNIIDMAIIQAINPIDGSNNYMGILFEHQGRINFLSKYKDYTFDNFIYTDDTKIPPQNFQLKGLYEGGYVNLTAQAFQFYGWQPQTIKTWWNGDITYYWGRCFIHWNGQITLQGKSININNAFGFGEFSRIR